MPFCQLQGDAFRSGDEDELSAVKVHNVIPELDAVDLESLHFRFQVVHSEADVVES